MRMITFETKVHVGGLVAYRIYRFFLRPGNTVYQANWPGTHLRLHMLRRAPGEVGSVVYMDEYVGERRVRVKALVTEAVPGRRLVLQAKKLVRLPVRLVMEFADVEGGVDVIHRLEVGYGGLGIVLDPFLRLVFSHGFARDLDAHVKSEFPRLGELLHVDTSEW